MVLYGTKISDDITLPYNFPNGGVHRETVAFKQSVCKEMIDSVVHKIHLHYSHNKDVYLGKDVPEENIPAKRYWSFEVGDVGLFCWEQDDNKVYYEQKSDDRLFGFWLAHSFLPIYLTLQRKAIILHASCVLVDENPIMFLAPSYGGKSTMAHYFLSKGHSLVSDDTVALFPLGDELVCAPSLPYCRPYRKLETLGEYVVNYADEILKPKVIYLLEKGDADSRTQFNEIKGVERFVAVQNGNLLYTFPHLRKDHFQHLATLLKSTPVFRVRRPWDLNRMEEVYLEICHHTKGLK